MHDTKDTPRREIAGDTVYDCAYCGSDVLGPDADRVDGPGQRWYCDQECADAHVDRWACVMLGRDTAGNVRWQIERSYGRKDLCEELAASWNSRGHDHLAWIVVPYDWTTQALAAA
jgi:hypothetical protein